MKAKSARLLGLMLVLALLLSGCNLIEIDVKMEADEKIAKLDKAYAQAVASYAGGEITIGEAIGDFNALYNETAYMYYYYFGYEMTHDDVHMLVEDVLGAHVRGEIVAAKFDEAHTLTEEELAQVESDVQATYDSYFAGALDAAEGDSDEARRENARVMLHESGVDYDSLYANILTNAKQSRMEEILRGEVGEVTDEQLQAVYDAKLAEQMEAYVDGYTFENDMSNGGMLICWQPDGYRTVKHILVMPDEDVKAAYSDSVYALEASRSDIAYLEEELIAANDDDIAEGERTPEAIQAEIDAVQAMIPDLEAALEASRQACLDNVKAVTDEIYARLEAGESFEALIAEYGQDPGMQNEPTMTSGYYVSSASQTWEVNFRDGAMALEQVGDYSAEPVVSGSGVHIIQYTADVLGGAVDFETVRDALYEEALVAAQDEYVEATIAQWIADANPSYDVAAFETAFGLSE